MKSAVIYLSRLSQTQTPGRFATSGCRMEVV